MSMADAEKTQSKLFPPNDSKSKQIKETFSTESVLPEIKISYHHCIKPKDISSHSLLLHLIMDGPFTGRRTVRGGEFLCNTWKLCIQHGAPDLDKVERMS
jgi:hypothetical protein